MGLASSPGLLFLICFSLVEFASSTGANPRFRGGFGSSVRRSAVDQIRDLNLRAAAGEVEMETEENAPGPRLVEKNLNLEIIGPSGSSDSIEELGHHAGYYRLPHTHAARMFYFFFESRGRRDDPVVLWLTGGPGCSSELAVFYENGPFTIADNMSLVWNAHGWDKASNMIFIDQPTGTGFSYSTDVRDLRYNERGIGDDVFDFLQEFFQAHPTYLKNDFYVTGESYAGHYIPAVAERIHRGNKEYQGLRINLKGFAIGNGLTNPKIQYRAYPDYALEMGIIEEAEYDRIKKIVPTCELATRFCGSSGAIGCLASLFICNSIFNSILLVAGDKNYYDIRKKCVGNMCYDFSNMEKFLNLNEVRSALGVGKRKFVPCSPVVYEAMLTDWMKNLEIGIPALIDDGIKLLVYAGEYDLICNWLGNYRWVDSMQWSGQRAFQEAPNSSFVVDGKEAGRLKTYGLLSFLKVHNAGHMVPMDQPKAALEMMKRWMKGTLHRGTDEPAVAAQ